MDLVGKISGAFTEDGMVLRFSDALEHCGDMVYHWWANFAFVLCNVSKQSPLFN